MHQATLRAELTSTAQEGPAAAALRQVSRIMPLPPPPPRPPPPPPPLLPPPPSPPPLPLLLNRVATTVDAAPAATATEPERAATSCARLRADRRQTRQQAKARGQQTPKGQRSQPCSRCASVTCSHARRDRRTPSPPPPSRAPPPPALTARQPAPTPQAVMAEQAPPPRRPILHAGWQRPWQAPRASARPRATPQTEHSVFLRRAVQRDCRRSLSVQLPRWPASSRLLDTVGRAAHRGAAHAKYFGETANRDQACRFDASG